MRSTRLVGQLAAAAVATAAILALLAPVGASAGTAPGAARAAADPSPTPSGSTAPADCPDLSKGTTTIATIISTTSAKMAACAGAASVGSVTFDAYFPAQKTGYSGGTVGSIMYPSGSPAAPLTSTRTAASRHRRSPRACA